MYTILDLYSLNYTQAGEYLQNFTYPWQALEGIKAFIISLGEGLDRAQYDKVGEGIWIHKSAEIASTAHIAAPCIIGENTEVRPSAYIRGSVLIGKNCVVGNSTELKNCILFDGVQVPHYNYVGDSILGYKVHLGAGAITSNVKSDKTLVVIKSPTECVPTERKKVGAFLGDNVEVGCNSVLNPGTVIGKNSRVYPLSCVRGVIEENCIYKQGGIVKIR